MPDRAAAKWHRFFYGQKRLVAAGTLLLPARNVLRMKNTYNQVPLGFTIDTEPIEGVLNGDFRRWSFRSQSPQFLKYVRSGLLESSAAWKGPIPKDIHMLYKSIWTAAEAKGYSFNEA